MLWIDRSRGRDQAGPRQTGDFGIRFFDSATRLPSSVYRRIRQLSLSLINRNRFSNRERPAVLTNRRGPGRSSARAAASRRAVCPLDEIGENEIARAAGHRRRKTHDQSDNRRVSRYRSCKRCHMTTRARPGRIVEKFRNRAHAGRVGFSSPWREANPRHRNFLFMLSVEHRFVARPRLRGWKMEVARSDKRLRGSTPPVVVTEKTPEASLSREGSLGSIDSPGRLTRRAPRFFFSDAN